MVSTRVVSDSIDRVIPGPPSRVVQKALLTAVRPLERLLRPELEGLEHMPVGRATLLVGNHQLLALDTPLLVAALWRNGQLVRPLADDFLFAPPGLSTVLSAMGVVRADPALAEPLLRREESVLVYPGGAREASKPTRRGFELSWWDRLGFARLALRTGAPIVTAAATGVDDRVRILLSGSDYLKSRLVTRLIDASGLRHDMLPPVFVPRGMPHPRFKLGRPIEVDRFTRMDPETAEHTLRAEVAEVLESELAALRARPLRMEPR